MLRVKALRSSAATLSAEAFAQQYGRVAMMQMPPAPVLQQVALSLGGSRTVHMAHRSRLADRILAMLRGFEMLAVLFFPGDEPQPLLVGRLPECALQVPDPSVSKQHAQLSWDAAHQSYAVSDAGSTNGTFVNATLLGPGEQVVLSDGDCLSFGDAQFLFLHATSLHGHLLTANRMGS